MAPEVPETMTTAGHADPHAADSMVGPHGSTDDHGEDHGHDDHAHGPGEKLGSIDLAAWSAGVLGIALGLVVVIVLAMSAGWLG